MTSPKPVSSRPADRAAGPVVHIVDDDQDLCQSLVFLLGSVGIETHTYQDAATFLATFDKEQPGVLIVDVRMPGLSGFQLQEELAAQNYPAPVIFCSAHGDIPMSVRALQHGAVNFLEKPYEPQKMLEVVQEQLKSATEAFAREWTRQEVCRKVAALTPREREVLRLVIDGLPSKLIARRLGTSIKTVDVHRARIKAKTDSTSLGALVRDVVLYGVDL